MGKLPKFHEFFFAWTKYLPGSAVFLEGVKRFDRLRLFRDVVGVEEGVVAAVKLFSLFSTE